MRIRLQRYSFRFAEQVLNSRLAIKQEIEDILFEERIVLKELSRPNFNRVLDELFIEKGWESQPEFLMNLVILLPEWVFLRAG